MEIQDVPIADGMIESVFTSMAHAEVQLVDWEETRWRLIFQGVLAVENFNIEGEDLDRLEVTVNDQFVERVRDLVNEPTQAVKLYSFFTAWTDEPRLRIVAIESKVKRFEDGRVDGTSTR